MNKTLLALSALTLGTAASGLPVPAAHADNAMLGMDMSGAPAPPKPAPAALSVTATVNPAAPQAGDNTLGLTILDAGGKPVTGLKLATSVAMTSMDMGTSHPPVTDKGGGHYTAKVNFGMAGPWRVVVRAQGSKVAVLDFDAGAKTPWKSPQVKATGVAPVRPTVPAAGPMHGMDMGGGKAGGMAGMKMDPGPTAPAAHADNAMPGMDMGTPKADGGMDMKTGMADMKTATIPELKETGTYTATGDEDWKKQTGFGHNAGMVGMMNQMMVGGSGMEGMKMAPMAMKFDAQNYAKPDAGDTDSAMPGMDMGGKAGMDMAAPEAGGNASAASTPVKITATMAAPPKAGDNPLTISLTNVQGEPVTGAKITASVAMTSMDMGTSHPAVTEKGGGRYAAVVSFGMAGPWRVQVEVAAPGQKAQAQSFDFAAR